MTAVPAGAQTGLPAHTSVPPSMAAVPRLSPGARARWFDKFSHVGLWAAGILALVFLLAPMAVIVLASFNRAPFLDVPPQHWSLASYSAISSDLYQSFFVSLKLAVLATLISVVLAVPMCFWVARSRGPVSSAADTFFRSPLQVPQIVLGLSLYQSFVLYQRVSGASLRATFLGLLFAHVILVTPYVVGVCVSSIQGRGQDHELAAANLGASPLRIFLQISLPGIRQAVVASAILAMLISFDNVPLSLFLAGPGTTPLPVQLFSLSEQNLTPTLYAAATLTVVFSIVVTAILEKIVGLRTALQR
jgi:putative spermidine/putrescine transport system permease protein